MECYITYCINGFYAFNDKNELITKKLFPKDKIVERLLEIEDKKIPIEETEIIESVIDDYDLIIIESNKRLSEYNNEKIQIKIPNQGGEYLRSNLDEFIEDIDEYNNLAIFKIKEVQSGEDKHLIQAIKSIEEIDESIGRLVENIREWYSLYFPEMEDVKNNETYIKLISQNKSVEELHEAFTFINDFDEDIDSDDLKIMNNYAVSIYTLQQTRKNIENYIDEKMESIAPNLKLLVGSSLGAKLISHAGGIKRLASYPSSTVQIMGAEKALFRHLKSGDRPPKYGLIYQNPYVRGAKWWNRGKIARLLASRISLASRKDVFTKDFNPNILNEFIEQVEMIEKQHPFPTKTSKKRNEEKPKRKNKRKKSKKKNKRR